MARRLRDAASAVFTTPDTVELDAEGTQIGGIQGDPLTHEEVQPILKYALPLTPPHSVILVTVPITAP